MKTIDFLTSTGSVALPTVALSYDRLGRFCKAAQGSLVDSNAYDSYGRITNTRQTVNGATYSLSYAYNEYSRIVGITLPDGTNLRKKFTPRGLADSIWFNPRLLASYSYKFGLETSRNLSNGIALAEGYDAAGRLASMVYTLTGQTLPNLGFGYDASGNRKLIRRNHYTTTSEAIGYTTDNQVSTWGQGTADANGAIATPTASQSWTLDSRGNWSGWTQNGTAQARTHTVANELTAMGSTALTWGAAGNLTSDGTLAYVWGARGLLDTAKQGTTIKGVYTYDPLGRRAMKTVGALKTISVYDGWQCVYQKVTGSGTDTTKIFAYGNYIDEPVAMIRKWGASTDTVWYLQGNNYNVEALTDRTGAVVERYEYTPYGKATVYTGKGTDAKWFTADDVSATVSAKGNAITFQGRELDAETGILGYRTRYYSSLSGRFFSRDPLRLGAGDENIVRFVRNRPILMTDPFGLFLGPPGSGPGCGSLRMSGLAGLKSKQEKDAWIRFTDGTRSDISLSGTEVASIVNYTPQFAAKFGELKSVCQDKGSASGNVGGVAGGPWTGSIGGVSIEISMTCKCNCVNWSASVNDYYDFDPKVIFGEKTHRSRNGELVTTLVWFAQVASDCGWKSFYQKGTYNGKDGKCGG